MTPKTALSTFQRRQEANEAWLAKLKAKRERKALIAMELRTRIKLPAGERADLRRRVKEVKKRAERSDKGHRHYCGKRTILDDKVFTDELGNLIKNPAQSKYLSFAKNAEKHRKEIAAIKKENKHHSKLECKFHALYGKWPTQNELAQAEGILSQEGKGWW